MNETLEMIQNYAASGKYKRVPVSRELYADAFTPISVMRTLRAASRHCYLLEVRRTDNSGEGIPSWAMHRQWKLRVWMEK